MPGAPSAPAATTSTPQGDGSFTLQAAPAAPVDNTVVKQPASAMLVSSSPARAATASNITKLQTITAPQPNTNTTTGQVTTTSSPTQPNSSTTPTQSTGGLTSDQLKAAGVTDITGWTQSQDPSGNTLFTPPAASSATPAGTTSTTTDPYADATSSITDPGLASAFSSSLQNLDSQISQAQSNIASIQQRSLNDPAVTGIVNSITAKYNQQISLMQAKNAQVIGRANTSVGAFGGLGAMSQSFLSDEQSQADARIQTLQDEEDSAIASAQAAYQTQNAKDLNTAMTQYDDANKAKLDALNNLLTASSKAVSEQQAQAKLDAQATKDALASDVTTSTKIAAGIASNIAAAGLTDPTQIQNYVAGLAQQYGISNPDILYSQVVTAQQAQSKADLAAQNTQDEMDSRDANVQLSTDRLSESIDKMNNPTPTLADKKQSSLDNLTNIITSNNNGQPLPGTNGIPVVDKNGFLTPEGLKTALAAAPSEGLTLADVITTVSPYLARGTDGTVMTTYGLNAALTKLANPSP